MTTDKIFFQKFFRRGENDRGYYGNYINSLYLSSCACFAICSSKPMQLSFLVPTKIDRIVQYFILF